MGVIRFSMYLFGQRYCLSLQGHKLMRFITPLLVLS